MGRLQKIFVTGLITLLPIAATIYILYSTISILESLFAGILRSVLGPEHYIPGLGLLVTLILIFIFGLLLNGLVTQRLLRLLEKKLADVPFIKAIYSPLRDLMNLFSQKDQHGMKSVVLVDIGEVKALGIVTRDHFEDIGIEKHLDKSVAVYIPLSYGVGGFTLLVPREKITPVDIPIEKAMSLAITGWVQKPNSP